MQSQERLINAQAAFTLLVAEGVDAGKIADKAVSIWCDVGRALSPIIGQRAVAALYKRSLSLTRAAYPWMPALPGAEVQLDIFAPLRIALSQQTSANVVAAHGALLQTFLDLLTHLIGGSLTERLLKSVWDSPSSRGALQETSS